MGPTLFIFLALVAGITAVPIIDKTDSCATQCTASSKFNYEPGTTYEFEYETELQTSLQGAAKDHAGVKLTAIVHLEFKSKCELSMKLSDVTMTEHDPETGNSKATSSELKTLLEKYPLRVSYQDGHIEHLCLAAPENVAIINIKRGILSVFQNNMDDITKNQKVSETDVTGDCEAEYSSGEKGWYNMVIKKSKNLLGCTGRQGAQSSIQGIPYTAQSDIQSLPIVKSTHECVQDININSGRLNSATCKEQHKFVPFSRNDAGVNTHSTQTLTFKRESSVMSQSAPVVQRVPLSFEHAYDADRAAKNRKDLQRSLMEICESTKSGVQPETPRLFTSLVYTMKTMEAADMGVIYQKVMSGAICSENQERVKKFFLDAIPMTGTVNSLKLMVQLLATKEVTGIEADMWLTTLAFIQQPTIDMIAEVKPLLSLEDNEEKAMLSVSSLVHSYCKANGGCENALEIKKIISILENKIGASCKVKDSNFKSVLLALRAIGNAGYGTSAITTLSKCIAQKGNPIEIRLSAIDAFRRIPCRADKQPVMDVFTDTDEDSELRIVAYKTLMECPTNEILSRIRVTLGKEEVNQVGSYVWSHLTNLMETSDPHKQAIRAILEDETLQKEFDLDNRKYSRNYEGSIFLEKINTGATVEGDLIWSSKSFIPRAGMFNFTVDLFGKAVNLFEVGGRVEGLEYFLESYFGPNGYFSENDVEAADETALKAIKQDKVSRIEKRMRGSMDELRGSLYMRVFGNELRYMNFKGIDSLISRDNFNFIDMLMKLSKDNDYSYSQSSMFMDSSIIIPTSAGFPMNLTVNGSATIDIKATGKMDVMKLAAYPPSLDISGTIRPSAAVEISSMMSVDAYVTKSGIKMVSSLLSNTMVKGKLQLSEGQVFNAEWDLPDDRMDIISVKSSFFTVHQDKELEQKMITQNRQAMAFCSGEKVALITGLELCGELQFPNASLVDEAPYFPLTGPVSMAVSLHKRDTFTGYKFEARSIHDADNNIVRVAFSTPNSKVDRSFGIDFNLNKAAGTFDTSITSPWKQGDFKGALVNEKSSKGLTGKFNWDGSMRYAVKALLEKRKSGPGMLYTPTLEISSPAGKDINVGGAIKYAAWKVLDINLAMKGLMKTPITLKGLIMKNAKMARLATTLSLGKDKDYSFQSALQTQTWKKKIILKPTITVRTPTSELLAVGGSFTNIFGKKMALDFVMDKVFNKPLIFKGSLGQKQYRRNRILYNIRTDLRSDLMDVKMKTKFDNRNWGTIATDIDLTYVIRKIARNNIKLVSKISNLSSKTLTKAKTALSLAVKRNPELNVKLVGNVNHNKKHSEVDLDVRYGADFKDEGKHIDLSASMDRAIKSWSSASAAMNAQFLMGKDLRMVAKASHKHDKRDLDTNVMLRLNKAAIETNLKLSDKSKDLKDMNGEFSLNYPGKKIAVTQTISESQDKKFTSNMNIQIGRSKNTIITEWKRMSPSALMISSNVNIQNMSPITIEGEYDLGPKTYSGRGLFSTGKSTYSAAVATQLDTGSIQITSDLLYPSKHIVATFDGSRSGDKYISRAELSLDADKDDTNRIVLTGNGNFPSPNNIDGSMTLQYPGRTVALNFKNIAQNKFISHVDFQWESGKVISIDTSFGDVTKRDTREIVGDLKLRTPFQMLKKCDVTLSQQIQDSQFVTSLDMEWNPKQIVSTTFTLQRPISLSSINAQLLAKTPIKSMKTIQASLSHTYGDRLSTVISTKWNKQSVQADISLLKKGNTNIKGQLDLKTSFKELKKAEMSFNYLSGLRKKSAELKFVKNKDTYAISSELKHNANGLNIQNSGNFKIEIPDESFNTEWDHSNTMNDISSTGTMTWKDNRIAIRYNGHQEMALLTGNMRSSLEIQSTFTPMRDIMLTMNHEHVAGKIDSNINLLKDGSTIASANGQYTRQDGKVTGTFRMTNPLGSHDLSAKVDAAYQNYPLTGRLELSASPDLTTVLDGSVMKTNGDIDSSAQLKFPYAQPISLKFTKNMDSGDIKTTGSIQYLPGKALSYESRYRNDMTKKLKLVISPPTASPMSFEVGMRGTVEAFDATAKINAMPLVDTWTATGSWDSRDGLSGSLRVNTPHQNISFIQVSAESRMERDERKSMITVEYMPNKVVKIVSAYNLRDPTDLTGSIKITTPFENIPYASFGFSHKGDLLNFDNKAEVEYQSGKRITASTSFSSLNGLKGSARVTSPITSEISGMFTHAGNYNSFQSRGEATWGKTVSIDLQQSQSERNFLSTLDISTGNDKYQGEIKYDTDPKLAMEMTLKTPFKKFENIMIGHTFDGNSQQFSSHSEFSSSYIGQYVADTTMNLVAPISGEITIRTPQREYRSMRMAFTHDGSLDKFASHLELENGRDRVTGDIRLNTDSQISFEAALKTPFQPFRLSRVAYTHDGSLDNFKCHAELQRNKDISEADLSARINKKIDVDLKVRSPYMKTLKVSFDHWGKLQKFSSKLRVSQGKLKASSDVRFQIRPTFNTFISLKTPISFLKSQQLSLKHAGGLNSFKCNMQYKCNGKTYIGDASYNNMDSMKGELNLKGPSFKPIGLALAHTGSFLDFQSTGEATYGKKKIQVNANVDASNGITGKLDIQTPFTKYENIGLALTHSGPVTNFKSNGQFSIGRQSGQMDLAFDTSDDITATLTLQTPFRGFEDISATFMHMGTIQDFNTIARYNQNKKAIEGKVGYSFGPVITGAVSIRSSFSNIDNYEASFRHESTNGRFKTHGEVTLTNQRSEADVELNSNQGYSGSITINSPTIKDTEVAFKHAITETTIDSNAYVSYGGDKKINMVAFGSLEPSMNGNFKLEIPFSEISMYHDGPLNNFKNHIEIIFQNDKHEMDTEFSSVANLVGKVTANSPLFKPMETSFTYTNTRQNLKTSAELSFGDSNTKGGLSLSYAPDISAELSAESPFFQPIVIKVEHTGPVANCRTTAEYLSSGESRFNWKSNFAIQPYALNSDVTVKTPVSGYRRFGGSVQHTGMLSNFKTVGEVFCEDSIHKAELTFSPRSGKLSIESPLTKPVEASFTINGQFPDVRSKASVEYGSEPLLTFVANLNTQAAIDGELEVSAPIIYGTKTLHLLFNHIGASQRFDSHAEISLGNTNSKGDISFSYVDNIEGSIAIQITDMTPISAAFKFDGEPTGFQSHGEVVYGNGKHEVDASFGMKNKIDASFTASSPFIRTVSMTFVTTKDLTNIDSNAKFNYRGEKKLDISTSWSLDPIAVSLTIITPRNTVKSNFNLNGNLLKFQSDAEITVNGQTTKIDVSLNVIDEFDGKLEVTSPAMYPTSLTFDCDYRMKSYKCGAAIDFQAKKHVAEITANTGNTKEGTVSLQSPYLGAYSGKVSVDGSANNFRTSLEADVNGEKTQSEINFSMISDIDAQWTLITPFVGYERNDISFTLNHSGSIKNLKANGILTFNKATSEIGIVYNIETAMEGSLSIKTPFTRDIDVQFQQLRQQLTGSINYGSETLFSTELGYNYNPLSANMKLELPFTAYKTISASFSHDGSTLKSNNHFEITVNDKTSEADMSFNFGSKLEGSITLKCPYSDDVTASFELSGIMTAFDVHGKFSHGSDKYAMDTKFDSNSDVTGEIIISTPVAEYKRVNVQLSYSGSFPFVNSKLQIMSNRRSVGIIGVQLTNDNKLSGSATLQSVFTPNIEVSFNHQGNLRGFASDAELKYNGQSNTASISLRTTPSIEGAVSLSLPVLQIEDMTSNFKYEGNLENFKFNAESRYGRKTISTEVNFTKQSQIALAASLKTPFNGYENIQGAFSLKEKYSGFDCHIELDLGSMSKSEFDIGYTWTKALKGSMTLKSPYPSLRYLKANLKHSGSLPTIQSGLTISHSGEDYTFGINVEELSSANGKVSITTPFTGFENSQMQYNIQGRFPNMIADAKIICAGDNEVSGTFRNTLSGQKLETKATLLTPYIEDIEFELINNGPIDDFNNLISLSMGSNNAISATTSLKYDVSSVDFETVLSTTRVGYSDEHKASYKFDGNLDNFKSVSYLKVFGEELSFDAYIQSRPSIDWKMVMKTPFTKFEDINLALQHSGNTRRFTTKAEVQYATGQKVEGTINYLRYGWRRLQTSVEIQTPFIGYERSSASYIHSASVDSFECNADLNVYDKDFSGTLKASKAPLSSSLSLRTPFENYEELSANMKLDIESSELSVTYMKDKTISMKAETKFEYSPKTASIKLITPFQGFESSELRYDYSGDMTNFQSTILFDTPFTKMMQAQSSLRSTSLKDFEGSLTLTSAVQNFENIKFNIQNKMNERLYNTHIETTWAAGQEIVFDSSYKQNGRSQTGKMEMTTPFEPVRQLVIKSDSQLSNTKFQMTASTILNGRSISDYDLELSRERGMHASLTMRSPIACEFEMSGKADNGRYSGMTSVGWKSMDNSNRVRVEADLDTTRDNTYSLKYQCPSTTIDVAGTLGTSSSKMDFIIDGERYGYDAHYTRNDGKMKLLLPTRNLEVFGSQDSKTTEGYFKWDADRDETKMISIRSVIVPTGDSMKADLSLMMPSIGKDVQLDSEMILGRGRVIFDGKTEFIYSRDSRKTIAFVTRLEDISSSWSVKNYSFTFGVSHPFSSVDIQMSSKIGKSDDKLTGSIDVEYQTVKRDVKSFKVNGELDKLRRSVSLNVNTPVKKISILGNSRLDAPFRMALENKYDDRRPLNTVFTLDPTKKSFDFQMNYDLDNPFNEFHVNAKYVNSSAIAAEVFHVTDRTKVTDGLLALRLNNSNLLHTRLHWRPTALVDLKAYASKKSNLYSARLSRFQTEVSEAINAEFNGKLGLIGNELSSELGPLKDMVMEMYEENDYHIKDVMDAILLALEDIRVKYNTASAAAIDRLRRLERVGDLMKVYMDSVNTNIGGMTDGLGAALTYISQENSRLYNIYSEKMYNMTRHPAVINLQQQYGDYITSLNSINLGDMADQYTSVMYNAREKINSRLVGLKDRFNSPIVQHGKNAVKYWEIRENTESAVLAIYNWLVEEINEDLDEILATIIRFEKSTVTVYDPAHGEIQTELHLPVPLKSLDTVPTVDYVPYINKVKKYVPSLPSISVPSSDVRTWIPPFTAMASIEGNKVTTFDGLTYDLEGTCTYVLAKDYVDGNFSLALKRDPVTSLIIMADKTTIELLPQGQVRVNNNETSLPRKVRSIEITSENGVVKVDAAGNFEIEYDTNRDLYIVRLSGWYHGKTSGLLGTLDNEASNDLITSYNRPVNNPDRFSRTWDIGTARCR